MRTAAEIVYDLVKSLKAEQGDEEYVPFKEFLENATKADVGLGFFSVQLKAINEARKECIEECAKKIFGNVYNGAKWDVTDSLKESILNLINELK